MHQKKLGSSKSTSSKKVLFPTKIQVFSLENEKLLRILDLLKIFSLMKIFKFQSKGKVEIVERNDKLTRSQNIRAILY